MPLTSAARRKHAPVLIMIQPLGREKHGSLLAEWDEARGRDYPASLRPTPPLLRFIFG